MLFGNAVTELNDVGYTIIKDVLSYDEIRRIRQVYEQLRVEDVTDEHLGKQDQRVTSLIPRSSTFRALAQHPTVVTLSNIMLGHGFICSSFMGRTTFEDYKSLDGWHSDYPYWTMPAPWPVDALALQVVWPINDFYDGNGATAVIRNSHRSGIPPVNPESSLDKVTLVASTGDMIIWDARIWHSATDNESRFSRTAILASYVRSYVSPMECMWEQLEQLENPTKFEQQLFGGNCWRPGESRLGEYFSRKGTA